MSGNKVIEYIIGAKDATANAINSAMSRINTFAKTARVAASTTAMMAGALSSLGGVAGKVSHAISSVAMGLMAFGPFGAVIAGIQATFSIFVQSAIDKANALKEAAERVGEAVREKLARAVARAFAEFSSDIDRVTKSTEYLTTKFENAAKAAEKMYEARKGTADARGEAEIAALERQAAENGGGADWALEIAKKREELTRKNAELEAAHEREMVKSSEERLALAEKNARALSRAYEKADNEYLRIRDSGLDADRVNTFKEKRDTVLTALRVEEERIRTARIDLEATKENATAGEIRRNNNLTNAGTDVIRAYDAVRQEEIKIESERQQAIDEQIKEEERARLEIERRIAAERVNAMRKELAERQGLEMQAQARLQLATQNEQQAWGWYRNKDAWKSQLEEERANAAAEKQFEKDAASLQRKTGWRSRTLSDDDEIVRRVLFAREEKQAAEDYARQTAEAAADAAAALERIQEVIEEGE